jgi:hypothetical protein
MPSRASDFRRELRQQCALALPVAASEALSDVLSLLATAWVGQGNPDALGAIALANSVQHALGIAILSGLSNALDTEGAQSVGGGDFRRLGYFEQLLLLMMLAVCVPLGIAWAFSEQLLRLTGQEPEESATAGLYLRVLALSLPAQCLWRAERKRLQCLGHAGPILLGNLLGVGVLCGAASLVRVYPDHTVIVVAAAVVAALYAQALFLLAYSRWHRGMHRPLDAMRRAFYGHQDDPVQGGQRHCCGRRDGKRLLSAACLCRLLRRQARAGKSSCTPLPRRARRRRMRQPRSVPHSLMMRRTRPPRRPQHKQRPRRRRPLPNSQEGWAAMAPGTCHRSCNSSLATTTPLACTRCH